MSADVAYRRYRRRILAWGAAALLAAFAIGATVTMTRVEDDLEGRLVAELDEVREMLDDEMDVLEAEAGRA